ncbi:hypothetical protein GQ44DRAFT_623410 [Phaeosphaeriaceae sp. PMI808]|nr:hypothetical protein GQ44DRAFT_623410 [Phaeosphaeriaceae sp. PMI808]
MLLQDHVTPDWTKASAPIAQVLNDSSSIHGGTEPTSTIHLPQAAPFSGKLADLLLNTAVEPSNKRRKAEDLEEPSRNISENSVIKLPQLPQLPAKTAKRPRIPPLLQGLHQPPPLPPTGQRFPPITDGVSGFEQDICERVQSVNVTNEARGKGNREYDFTKNEEPRTYNEIREEATSKGRDVLPSPISPVPTIDQVKASQPDARVTGARAVGQNTQSRKRKKWSDQETRDLLLGVSRFGIGSWKKILHCQDFTFEGRTAVDLKDRFRVCCPGEGLKLRKQKQKNVVEGESAQSSRSVVRSTPSAENSNIESPSHEKPQNKDMFAKGAGNVHRMSKPELAKLGIQTPFARNTRRPRQVFNAQDDENLFKGFEKYGAAWHSMRDDKDLGFGSRHPTDLRDRFRIRYPGAYARAGYKLRTKAKNNQENEPEQEVEPNLTAPRKEPSQLRPRSRDRHPPEPIVSIINDTEAAERSFLNSSSARPLTQAHSMIDSAPFFLGDISGSMSADEDGTLVPIVLNRNILQWADANTALMSASTTAHTNNQTLHFDSSSHITIPTDVLHINPLATLKLPSMTHSHPTTNIPPLHSNFPTSSTTNTASAPASRAYGHATLDANNSASAIPSWAPLSKATADQLLRTPNLPTIVFPHVPAASARTTMHNLPTPADLLSGMDLDAEG